MVSHFGKLTDFNCMHFLNAAVWIVTQRGKDKVSIPVSLKALAGIVVKFSIPFIVLRLEQPEKTLSAKDEQDDKSTSVKLVQLLKAPFPKSLHFERFILESFVQVLKAHSPIKVQFDKSMVVKLVQP